MMDFTLASVASFFQSKEVFDVSCAAAVMVGFVIAAYVLRAVVQRRLAPRAGEPPRLVPLLFQSLVRPGFYLVLAIGARAAAGMLMRSWPQIGQLADGVFYVVTVFLGAYSVFRLADGALEWYIKEVAARHEERVREHFAVLARKALKVCLFVWAGIAVIEHFGYDIKTILATLGIASLAVGLAAKDTVENMICGVTILLDRPFRVGDRIQLASGQIGDVYEIGLRTVKILTLEGTMVVVPNAQISTTPILNLSYPDPSIRLEASIGVAYGTDPGLVKETLERIAAETPDVLPTPPPFACFKGHGDFSLDFVLYYWINSYKNRGIIHDHIQTAINREFTRLGINIPFPIRHVILQHAKPEPTASERQTES